MCSFGLHWLAQLAIAVIVLLAAVAIIRFVFPSIFDLTGPYGGIVKIVMWAAIAVVFILICLRLATCAGVAGVLT